MPELASSSGECLEETSKFAGSRKKTEACRYGHIVNVACVSGHRVDPSAAVYCATKFAVRALSEERRHESRNVRVTVVSPGLIRCEPTQGIPYPHVRQAVDQMTELSSMPDALDTSLGEDRVRDN